MTAPTGVQTGREVYGTFVDVVINPLAAASPLDAVPDVTFPGEIQGLAVSSPAANAGQDQRQRAPSGNVRVIEPDVSQQARTVTLAVDAAAHLRDYQDIAALEGTTTQLQIKQRRVELVVADETTATVAITEAWHPTFVGATSASDVAKGMAIQVAGEDYVIRELIEADNDLTKRLDQLDRVLLDEQGLAGSDYVTGTNLDAAVAASVYKVVWPETETELFAVRVVSAPRLPDFNSGERGQVGTVSVVLELVGDNVPFERITNLPTVDAS